MCLKEYENNFLHNWCWLNIKKMYATWNSTTLKLLSAVQGNLLGSNERKKNHGLSSLRQTTHIFMYRKKYNVVTSFIKWHLEFLHFCDFTMLLFLSYPSFTRLVSKGRFNYNMFALKWQFWCFFIYQMIKYVLFLNLVFLR